MTHFDYLTRKKNKRTLKIEHEFELAFHKLMENYGARANTVKFPHMYPYMLGTQVGPLIFSIHDGWIAMRFVEIPRAAKRLKTSDRLNRYSGKFNFHFDDHAGVDERLAEIKREIEPIL